MSQSIEQLQKTSRGEYKPRFNAPVMAARLPQLPRRLPQPPPCPVKASTGYYPPDEDDEANDPCAEGFNEHHSMGPDYVRPATIPRYPYAANHMRNRDWNGAR